MPNPFMSEEDFQNLSKADESRMERLIRRDWMDQAAQPVTGPSRISQLVEHRLLVRISTAVIPEIFPGISEVRLMELTDDEKYARLRVAQFRQDVWVEVDKIEILKDLGTPIPERKE